MQRDHVETICEQLPGAWPDSPWEHDIVYKIGPADKGKIFCFLGGGTTDGHPGGISIKVDPIQIDALHQQYDAVDFPRYLSKQHWIAVQLDGDIPDDELEELIEDSYRLVLAAFSKKMQRQIASA